MKTLITGLVLATLATSATLTTGASAHSRGYMTTRYSAQWEVRDILLDEYGWYATNVRCGSSSWSVGIHFPCRFSRLGSQYIVCYHSVDGDYGYVTSYSRYSCNRWY